MAIRVSVRMHGTMADVTSFTSTNRLPASPRIEQKKRKKKIQFTLTLLQRSELRDGRIAIFLMHRLIYFKQLAYDRLSLPPNFGIFFTSLIHIPLQNIELCYSSHLSLRDRREDDAAHAIQQKANIAPRVMHKCRCSQFKMGRNCVAVHLACRINANEHVCAWNLYKFAASHTSLTMSNSFVQPAA